MSTMKLELDSHADSPILGNKTHVLDYTSWKVSVSGCTDELGNPLLVEVINMVVTNYFEEIGSSYFLLINNVLLILSIDCCLISSFITRMVRLQVDDCLKFISPIPAVVYHSFYFPEIDFKDQCDLK